MQLNKLKYELENQQQERELLTLQHQKELRDLQAKADADYKKAQVCSIDRDCYIDFGLTTPLLTRRPKAQRTKPCRKPPL